MGPQLRLCTSLKSFRILPGFRILKENALAYEMASPLRAGNWLENAQVVWFCGVSSILSYDSAWTLEGPGFSELMNV